MPYITLPTFDPTEPIDAVAWRPQGDKFAVGGQWAERYAVVDAATGAVETGWPAWSASDVRSVSWSPDGTRLAVTSANTGPYAMRVIDVASKTYDLTFPEMPNQGMDAAWSPDGTRLAVAHRDSPGFSIIDIASKAVETGWPTSGWGYRVSWSPDGTRLALASSGSIVIADVASKAAESGWSFPGLVSIGYPAWSPDGTRLAYSSNDPTGVGVIDVASKTAETGWPALAGSALGIAWSGDSSRLAVAHSNGNGVTVLNVATKTAEGGWPALPANGRGVAFAFDPGNSASG